MTKVFIDGSAGTTGLRIRQRLAGRRDLTLITLPEELRKDESARAWAINSADVVFLCLPDEAARQAAALAKDGPVIIDTSTAHRTSEGWAYGFPELPGRREAIKRSGRIANPGCHASGFIALVAPLAEAGLLDKSALLTCFSLTGYSGGGKKMIAQYEADELPHELNSPRQYGLSQKHKHLPEMQQQCRLDYAPVFCPIVANFYSGMEVTVSLFPSMLKGTLEDVRQCYRDLYRGPVVKYAQPELDMLSANLMEGRDDMIVTALGNEDRIILTSLFDNLGKGASGAAIQNMNIVLGLDETEGLNIKETL
ncbi:MAG: N-acetyl-gamma-glutamyl-phosphate reductase [Oscillospiraceae bacterium]|nr:N-acetyl-gamma-glutamyl-phosphate reductase [Oscillospiraceae bacterium]